MHLEVQMNKKLLIGLLFIAVLSGCQSTGNNKTYKALMNKEISLPKPLYTPKSMKKSTYKSLKKRLKIK